MAITPESTASAEPVLAGVSAAEIIYLSSDRSNAIIFSGDQARQGSATLAFELRSAGAPVMRLRTAEGVDCVSIGIPAVSTEFAIRRPIRVGDRYGCRGSRFRVIRCFDRCRSAVIQVETPATGRRGTRRGSMIVDACSGLLVESAVSNLSRGIPLSAPWLRGEWGILADPADPACRAF